MLGRQSVMNGITLSDSMPRGNDETFVQIKETIEAKVQDYQSYIISYSENNEIKKIPQETYTGNRYFNEAEAYRKVLEEYEYASKSTDETYEPDKWEYMYDLLFFCADVYYSLKDLNNDNHPELIIGVFVDFGEDNCYQPFIIYHYSEKEGIVWSYITEGHTTNLYEGGIVEGFGPGMRAPRYYYQFLPDDSGGLKGLGHYETEEQDNGTKKYFYDENGSDDEMVEISEEEYREAIDKYTASPIELEWFPIEGFLTE